MGDNGGVLVTKGNMKQKSNEVATPLQETTAHLRKAMDTTSQAMFEDMPETPTVETVKLQAFEDDIWVKDGVPSTLVQHIGNIKDTLCKMWTLS